MKVRAGGLAGAIWTFTVVAGSLCLPGVALAAPGVWSRPSAETSAAVARRNRWLAVRKVTAAAQAPASSGDDVSDDAFNECKKPPPGKQVPVTLKPDTDVIHLIRWISSITCKAFVWSEAETARNRHVTIVAPATVTRAQAFRLFLDAMNSIGLTVQPSAGFFQIIEAVHAKSRPVPTYDWNGHRIGRATAANAGTTPR